MLCTQSLICHLHCGFHVHKHCLNELLGIVILLLQARVSPCRLQLSLNLKRETSPTLTVCPLEGET